MRSVSRALGILVLIVLAAAPASARMGSWERHDVVKARLIGTVGENGVKAALEIVLEPGWKTYWRTPGEGGLPTLVDFALSRNLGEATIGYPAPHRYDAGYGATNVYEGTVLFPITLDVSVPSAPLVLHARIDFGVCETICIPMHLEPVLTIEPGDFDAEAGAAIAAAEAAMPAVPTPGDFEVVAIAEASREAAGAHYEATVIVPQAFGTELFVEGPTGWLWSVPQQVARDGDQLTFAFGFAAVGGELTTPVSGTPVTLTLVSNGDAIEQRFTLP